MERIIFMIAILLCTGCCKQIDSTKKILPKGTKELINEQILREKLKLKSYEDYALEREDSIKFNRQTEIRKAYLSYELELIRLIEKIKRGELKESDSLDVGAMERSLINKIQNIYPHFYEGSLRYMEPLNFPIDIKFSKENGDLISLIFLEKLKTLEYINCISHHLSKRKLE